MARSTTEIYDSILAVKEADPVLSGLNSTSKTAIWRLWTYVTAVHSRTVEVLFDEHQAEVRQMIDNERLAYAPWIKEKCLDFQFGYDLVPDEIYYDNTGIDEAVIAASKVVKYVAIVELTRGLLVKVAGLSGGDLGPLPPNQEAALAKYLGRVKPPGVGIMIINRTADSLKLKVRIYHNPLILDQTGKRLDGTNDTPIQQAISAFLLNQPFNGQFILNRLERALEEVEGVIIAPVLEAQASYASVGFIPFNVYYLPDSGYLRFANPSDLEIEFVPHESI